MATKSTLKTTIITAVISFSVAFITCFLFFFFYSSTPQLSNNTQPVNPPQTPLRTPSAEIPNPEIKASDVSSVDINTVYTGYFDKTDKCSKTYNEYFGNEDGIGSSSSPCTIKMSFDRDGSATRLIEISRWDRVAKAKKVVEKTESTATLRPGQFEMIVQAIVNNEAFKNWREGTMINVSNCSIGVHHTGGAKTPMSNVGPTATAYLPMVEAFRKLEKELDWKTR
jgi:hypothetical protein